MKKIFIISLILMTLLLVSLVEARVTVISKGEDLKIDLIKFDPSPVSLGSETEVSFEITNLRKETIPNSNIKLVTKFPLEPIQTDVDIPSIQPGETLPFSFKFTSNENAQTGDYIISVQFYSPALGSFTSEPFSVPVITKRGSISGLGFSVNPETVSPGDRAQVTVNFRNTELSSLEDVVLKLDLSNTTLPFAPVQTGTEQTIKTINPGASASVTFDLIVFPDAASNVYRVPLSLIYYDSTGVKFTKNEVIGIVVGAKPKYQLDLEDSTVYQKGKSGKVVLSLSNIGPTDMKFTSLTLLTTDNYDVISKSRVYVGNLKPDDFETAEFNVYVKSPGELKVQIEYKDTFNNDYSEIRGLTLPVYDKVLINKYGLTTTEKNGQIFTFILILLVVVIIIGWVKTRSLGDGIKYAFSTIFGMIIKFFKQFTPTNIKKNWKTFKEFAKKQ